MRKFFILLLVFVTLSCSNSSQNPISFMDFEPKIQAIEITSLSPSNDLESLGSYFYRGQSIASQFLLRSQFDILVIKIGKSKKMPPLEILKKTSSTAGKSSNIIQTLYDCHVYQNPLSITLSKIILQSDGMTIGKKVNDSLSIFSANFKKLSINVNNAENKLLVLENEKGEYQDIQFMIVNKFGQNFIILLSPRITNNLKADMLDLVGQIKTSHNRR